jgi:hypothetical protein
MGQMFGIHQRRKVGSSIHQGDGRWEPLVKTHLVHIVNSKDDGKSLLMMCRGNVSRYQLGIRISVPLEILKCSASGMIFYAQ